MINPYSILPLKYGVPDTDWLWGIPQDVTAPGDGTGSPWLALTYKDLLAPWQLLMRRASMVPNGTPDNPSNAQAYDAMSAVFRVRTYHADNDNYVNDRNIGSDGDIYKCLIDNGPNIAPANPTVDPVGNLTGTWFNLSRPVLYNTLINYSLYDRSIGSDGNQYEALIPNGPGAGFLPLVDPVGDLTSTWRKTNQDQKVIQIVNFQDGEFASGTTVMPSDDTIPQNTEGDEYMSLVITPKATTNKLEINVTTVISNGAAVPNMVVALFQDAVTDALSAVKNTGGSSGSQLETITFSHTMTAGTISAITFKVRAGAASGTTSLNGFGGSRKLGGVCASSITITEYTP